VRAARPELRRGGPRNASGPQENQTRKIKLLSRTNYSGLKADRAARWHVPPASIAIAAIDQAEAIMEPEVIRRQPGNAIDYDFYRRRAARARREAMREFARPLRIGLLAAGAVAALSIVANAPAQRVHCPYRGGDTTTSAY
jgi:hypothetical protein